MAIKLFILPVEDNFTTATILEKNKCCVEWMSGDVATGRILWWNTYLCVKNGKWLSYNICAISLFVLCCSIICFNFVIRM